MLNIEIRNKDCIQGLSKLDDKSIDLILTDPPYGLNIAKNGFVGGNNMAQATDYKPQEWDEKIPDKEAFEQMFRVAKNLIIFGGNYMTEYLPPSSCWIVWDKQNTGNFADCELAWTSFKTAVRKFKWRWNGMIQEQNWKEKRFHPTQKPLGLIRQILKEYGKEGQLICDPFMGSGTTALACKQLSMNFIGFEINPEYCKIARERLQQDILSFPETKSLRDFPQKEESLIIVKREANASPNSPHIDNKKLEEANFS